MSLDEPRNTKHAAMLQADDHPGWLEAARAQEAADDARAEAEWRDRELCESVEAMESYWTGVAAQMPDHIRRIRYEGHN